MPLTKLQFKPGINKETTSYSNEGGWFDMDKVRFRFGYPEKIGGWIKDSNNSFLGSARALHPWVTLDLDQYLGVGTAFKYYINQGGAYYDVTPIRSTTAAGDVTFTAVDGSNEIQVTDASHGAVENDFVTFTDAVSLGGNITAAVLNQEYQVNTIVDSNNYIILAREVAPVTDITIDGVYTPTTVNANSSDSGNGGSATVGTYQINVGLNTTVAGNGWGAGTWSRDSWGSAAQLTVVTDTLRVWSHDNFGEDLIMNVRDGGIYYWDASLSSPLGRPAVELSSLSNASTTPTVAKIVNRIPKGANISSVSTPGIPSLLSQTLNNKIATEPETADATSLALGDMSYPKSSASPTANTGAADKIKSVSCSTLRSKTTESGMKPKVSRGMSTSIPI